MNHFIFLKLYSLLYKSVVFDNLILFLAEYLIIVAALIVFVVFVIDGLFESKNKLSILKKNFKKIIFIISPASISWAFTDVLKNLLETPRPFLVFEDVKPLFLHGGMDSFPSGHATFMSALALSVYFFNKKLGIILFVSAFLVGVSRVIAGVHFPIDIIGGFFVGIIFTFIFEEAFKGRKKF